MQISPISLQTLTAAALCLPGLMQTPAYAAEEESSFTYGHYQEGNRNLYGAESAFSPIEVESLQGSAKFKLTDRIKFAFNYVQDTWGGATPISTAPLSAGGNGQFTGGGPLVSGATPYIEPGNRIVLDKNMNVLRPSFDSAGSAINDANGQQLFEGKDQFVDTMAQASPETRKQGDFKLGYEWDEAALDIGGGISTEDDYESRFGNINTRWDFNQKTTILNVGLSYTNSDTYAILDHDGATYIRDKNRVPQFSIKSDGTNVIQGTRQDWSTSLGLTQILNKNALMEAGLGYTRSTGYMANPYKAVSIAFIDPALQDIDLNCPEAALGLQCVDRLRSLLEQRPDERNQWTGNLRYVQHIDAVDAALHLGYRVFSDDWGITSHTFDADWAQPLGNGWTVTPRVRYYSQDSANFYTPMLVTSQGYTSNAVDGSGREIFVDAANPNDGRQFFLDPDTGGYVDAQGNDVTVAVNN